MPAKEVSIISGPGLLYQRGHMLPEAEPAEAELHMDDGGLDFSKLA